MQNRDAMLQKNWSEAKPQVLERWDELTEEDVDEIDGSSEDLIALLQDRYGYSHERAERECEEFCNSLQAQGTGGRGTQNEDARQVRSGRQAGASRTQSSAGATGSRTNEPTTGRSQQEQGGGSGQAETRRGGQARQGEA